MPTDHTPLHAPYGVQISRAGMGITDLGGKKLDESLLGAFALAGDQPRQRPSGDDPLSGKCDK